MSEKEIEEGDNISNEEEVTEKEPIVVDRRKSSYKPTPVVKPASPVKSAKSKEKEENKDQTAAKTEETTQEKSDTDAKKDVHKEDGNKDEDAGKRKVTFDTVVSGHEDNVQVNEYSKDDSKQEQTHDTSETKNVDDIRNDASYSEYNTNSSQNDKSYVVESDNKDERIAVQDIEDEPGTVDKREDYNVQQSRETKGSDSNVDEDKPKDTYVPLDQLWSSPKREYKGIQREYSFNSKKSTPKVDETEDKSANTKESEEKSHIVLHKDVAEDKSQDDMQQYTNTSNSEVEQIESESQIVKNESDNEQTETKLKSAEKLHTNDSFDEKSEPMQSNTEKDKNEIVQEDSQKEETEPQEDTFEEEILEYWKKESVANERTVISPRSDSSSRSKSPRRSPPPTTLVWENGENKNQNEQVFFPEHDELKKEGSEKGHEELEKETSQKTEEKQEEEKEDLYEDKFEVESDDNISVTDTTDYSKTNVDEKKEDESSKSTTHREQDNEQKQNNNRSKRSSTSSPSPRQIVATRQKFTQRPVTRSAQPTSRPSETRRALSPAQMRSPRSQYGQYTPRSKPRPKTTPGHRRPDSRASEEGRTRQKEFFRAELSRLQKSLKDESSKISKPKQREHYPFVWTSLEPYYNTYVANFLIDTQEEAIYHPHVQSTKSEEVDAQRPISRGRPVSRGKLFAEDPQPGYVSRNTAIGLCDPWTDLRMDRELLPRLETPSKKARAKGVVAKEPKRTKKDKPPKQGSTRLPKFPVVEFKTDKENATKKFPYSEVPKFRQEMYGRYSKMAPKVLETDYNRTRNDFYRMDLDRLDEVHPINRPHMRKAYFAYLQNTPGSKKAVKECVKGLNAEQTNATQKAN